MFGFPISTEFNKRIPKQKFYENIEASPSVKRIFAEQIKTIYWRNKLSVATLAIDKGEAVGEIEVLELKLSKPFVDEAVLRQIDKAIPYHILFVLTYEGKAQAWIGYKEASVGGHTFKVNRHYHTEWVSENELQFTISGLNMDAVYESLVRQIAGERLQAPSHESLKESVGRDEERRRLERQIAALENTMRKEKQLNRKMELNAELKRLKKQLEVMNSTPEER